MQTFHIGLSWFIWFWMVWSAIIIKKRFCQVQQNEKEKNTLNVTSLGVKKVAFNKSKKN